MKQSKKNFRHESLQDAATIQGILKSITRGFAKGELVFSDDEDEIVMHPEGLMNLKITSSLDHNRHKINIRISWQTEDEAGKQNKSLTIK